MKQYQHRDFKFDPKTDKEKVLQLEETITNLEKQVQILNQKIAFLERQDQRSRSSFETIQSRINARK
jgi:chaperonin cofactor prefoldin